MSTTTGMESYASCGYSNVLVRQLFMADPTKYTMIWEFHQDNETVYILGHQASDGFFEVHVIRGRNGVNYQRLGFARVYKDELNTKQLRFNRSQLNHITEIIKDAILAQYEDGLGFLDTMIKAGDPFVIEPSLTLNREDQSLEEAFNTVRQNPYKDFIEGLDLDDLAD